MKVTRVPSLGLPLGIRVRGYEEADVKKLLETPANLTRLTDITNLYLRQKGPLVWARDDIAQAIREDIKFPMPQEDVVEDGKTVKVDALTPGKYIDAFISALIDGTFTSAKFTVTGADKAAKESSVMTGLQALMDTLGDVTEDGTEVKRDPKTDKLLSKGFAYVNDIARAERQPGKPKNPPEYAVNAATNIINNKNEGAWAKKFTAGFKDAQGYVIPPISFEPFDAKPDKGATPEQVEATRQANIRNLAFAIAGKEAEVRKQRENAAKAEFA